MRSVHILPWRLAIVIKRFHPLLEQRYPPAGVHVLDGNCQGLQGAHQPSAYSSCSASKASKTTSLSLSVSFGTKSPVSQPALA